MQHAINVIKKIDKYINYITIEHIKIYPIPIEIKQFMLNFANLPVTDFNGKSKMELRTEIKKHNIEEIRKITNVKIGLGDNDLHESSDSYNCCGIDTINKNFNNWIKYNSMYIKMTNPSINELNTLYTPKTTSLMGLKLGSFRKLNNITYKELINIRMVRQHLTNVLKSNIKVIVFGEDKEYKSYILKKLYFLFGIKPFKENVLYENKILPYDFYNKRVTLSRYNKRKRELYENFIYDNIVNTLLINEEINLSDDYISNLETKFLEKGKVIALYFTNSTENIMKTYNVNRNVALDIKSKYTAFIDNSKFNILISDGSMYTDITDRTDNIITTIAMNVLNM